MSSRASLNHIFRTVWNQALGAMVAVAEITSSGGRSKRASGRSLNRLQAYPLAANSLAALSLGIAAAWGALPASVLANPAGGVAIVGQASFANQGNKLTVTTQNGAGGNYSAINWQSFSIPAGSATYFQQPNAASTSINRVVTNTPSLLFGTLGSNGNLVLVNQSGITVGAGAVVDTAGFTASSLRMSDADALAGRLRFGDGSASATGVSVQGSILARSGDVVLLGSNIDTGKDALIQAPNGSTILAAGRQIELTGRGLEGISLQVQAPADQAVNLGTLQGDAVGIFAGTLKHSGLIQATTANIEGGKVVLKATGDAYVEGAGRILATGTVGGSVDVLGNRVAVTDQAVIDVSGEQGGGSVRVGGDYQGRNPDIQNANITYFGSEASIKADATTRGDGGKVIVWADDTTRAHGSISAIGGAQGGSGGFVETSGHRYLDANGVAVNTYAPHGQMGTWLLDPTNIYIAADQRTATSAGMSGTDTSVNSSGPSIFQATGFVTDSLLTTGTLQSNLVNNSVVVSTANISGYGGGVISVVSPVNWSNSNSLTLTADGSININAPITAALGTLNLNAGSGYGAAITQGYGASITAAALTATTSANYANITLTEVNNVGTASFTAGPAGYGGNVSFTNTGALTLGNVTAYGLTVDTSSGNGSVFQSGGTKILLGGWGADFNAGSGNLTLMNSGNIFGSIGITSAGTARINDSGSPIGVGNITADSFTLVAQGNVYSYSPITTSGAVDIRTSGGYINFCGDGCATIDAGGTIRLEASADLVFGNLASTASGDAVTLISTGGIFNANFGNGIITTPNGRALAYLNEDNSCQGTCHYFGGLLPSFKQYNASFGTAVLGSGDGVLYSGAAFLGGGLTGTVSKTYDASTSISLVGAGLVSGIGAPSASNGDDLSIAQLVSGTGMLDNKNVGTGKLVTAQAVVVSGVSGAEGSNLTVYGYGFNSDYVLSGNIGNVTPAAITAVSNITASNKVYDGNTSANLNTAAVTLAGAISGDNVTVAGATGAFSDKNAGLGKTVNVTGLGLSGTDASNYTLASTTTSTVADITPAPLSVTANNAGKTYDGVAYSGGNGVSYSGFVNSETAAVLGGTLTYSGTSQGAINAGSYLITPGGLSPGNYSFNYVNGALIIDPVLAAISLTGMRTYDGTNIVNASIFSLSGLVGSETLALTGSGTVTDKNVGLNKPVSLGSLALGNGSGLASNYILSGGTQVVTITPATLTSVSGISASNKVYDGTTTATLNTTATTFAGAISGDSLSVTGATGAFSDKNAGVGKTVNITGIALAGTDALNYTLGSSTASTTADISKAAIAAVTGITAANKVYDGSTLATLNSTAAAFNGAIGGDVLSVTGAAGAFSDKNAGSGKTVSITGIALSGTDAGNYTLSNSNATTTAAITPKPLSGVSGITAGNKVYDGNTVAAVNTAGAAFGGLVSGDSLTVGSLKADFVDRNVGVDKTVNITNLTLSGADAANYTVAGTIAPTKGTITVRPLSTWTAAGSGQWSDAGNWDALPDASNVLAVSIPVGVAVTYDAAVVPTNLQTVSSAGTLSLAGGALSVANGLTTPRYSQTSGALGGAGSLSVNGSFSQTGGSIAMGGPVSIIQSTGNLSVGSVNAATISLSAPAGGIAQSAGLVTTGLLTTQSLTNTTLNNAGNHIGSFKATTSSAGNVELTNVGALDVQGISTANGDIKLVNTGGISTSGPVVAGHGAVTMTSNSPLTVGVAGIAATNDITLTATNLTSAGNMTLDGPLDSSAGGITLAAANNFVQNSTLTAALAINVAAGGTLTFGPFASSTGHPVNYSVNGVPLVPPWVAAIMGAATNDFVVSFARNFEDTLALQAFDSGDPLGLQKKIKDGIVVEGEICPR